MVSCCNCAKLVALCFNPPPNPWQSPPITVSWNGSCPNGSKFICCPFTTGVQASVKFSRRDVQVPRATIMFWNRRIRYYVCWGRAINKSFVLNNPPTGRDYQEVIILGFKFIINLYLKTIETRKKLLSSGGKHNSYTLMEFCVRYPSETTQPYSTSQVFRRLSPSTLPCHYSLLFIFA